MTQFNPKLVSGPGSGKQTPLQDWVRALEAIAPIAANPHRVLADAIEDLAQIQGDAIALVSARETLTYRSLIERANRYARWALNHKLGRGEVVCLMMPSRPEYLAIWLGITRVGAVVSLVNTNLRGSALVHSVEIIAPKHIIVDVALQSELEPIVSKLVSKPQLWCHGEGQFASIDDAIQEYTGEPLNKTERRDITIGDPALYIYTSGTTGLPKAANISHNRLMQWSFWFAGLMNTGPNDRMYNSLPMYHSVGGVVANGAVLVRGGSIFIREKFSANEFWREIHDRNCTLFQYIGEMCRYLVNAPSVPQEREHRLRLCCGNGLRADVWKTFQERFAIPRILEFYAATEGNVSLYNVEGKPGAIGRVPAFLGHRFPLALVKFDSAAETPVRDRTTGRCVRCAPEEIGEALGRVRSGTSQYGEDFEGYTDPVQSQQKIIRDVFERGDAWYRTGDLMRRDASGFFYFVDRIGDTFRWKGENVSTSAVAEAIGMFPGVRQTTVYGVQIPGIEGSAGMASIVTEKTLHLGELREHLVRNLPNFALPLFVRISSNIDVTSTFKHKKNELKDEGFNPESTRDTIFFYDSLQQAYVKLNRALYERIVVGEVRLG